MTADPTLLSVPCSLSNLLTLLHCRAHKAEDKHVLICNSQQTLSSTASQRHLGKLVHHLRCCTHAVQADLGVIAKKELSVHNYLQKIVLASSIPGCHHACIAVCSCVIASVNL